VNQANDQAYGSNGGHAWYTRSAAHVSPRLFVFAGILMFVLYLFMDVAASLAYHGYSYKDQTISELSAIDAPTRTFWLVMSVFYQALAFAFAYGVLAVAGARRKIRTVGGLLLLTALAGLLWWIAPMHQREVLAAGGDTWQDTMHLVTAGVSSVLFFAMIGVGAFVFGRRFRWYSAGTIALMLLSGALMNIEIPKVDNNEPTPWLGIWERIAIEGAMLWQAVFAAVLLWTSWSTAARDA
jgi:hypothetical protein